MRRTPLETIVLKTKMLDLGNPVSILALALDPPNKTDILNSILMLKEVGAMLRLSDNGEFVEENGEVTFMGRIMAGLPLDVRLSKLIVMGYCFSVLDETIKIAAGLNLKSIFKQDYARKLDAYSTKLSWADGSGSDCIAILNAYKTWSTRIEQGQLRDAKIEKAWCDRYLLEIKSLHDMRELIREIEHRLTHFNLKEGLGVERVQWTDKEKAFVLKVCFAGAFYPNFFLRSNQDEKKERLNYATLGGLDPCNTVYFGGNDKRFITEIYEDVIKEKFVDKSVCRNKEQIKITFDSNSSKIYVTFNSNQMIDDPERENWNSIVPGKVVAEVYKAIKYRNTEEKFSLKIMDPKRAEAYACQIGIGEIVDGSFTLKNYYIKFPKLCVIPSSFQDCLVGIVTHIEHCSKFYIRPIGMPYADIWRDLSERIKKCKLTPLTNLNSGFDSNAIVKYKDNFHRGRIIKQTRHDEDTYAVYLIDVGSTVTINMEDISPANSSTDQLKVFEIPPRIFEATLCDIQPSFIKCPKGKWISGAVDIFRENVFDQTCEVEVYSVVQDVASVHLKIDGIDMNELLVKEGFAQFAEENFMSKVRVLMVFIRAF